jgi:hypothetical protein
MQGRSQPPTSGENLSIFMHGPVFKTRFIITLKATDLIHVIDMGRVSSKTKGPRQLEAPLATAYRPNNQWENAN